MAEALRSIAGLPPLHDLLPSASSPQWRWARTAFERAALDHGCRLRLRSPATLWQLLHGSGLPRGATWEGLLRDLTVASLAHRAQAQAPRLACRIATWNCRWLPALTTSSGRSKAGQVQRAVCAGTLVLLQETHLDDAAMALWAAGLHGCRVIHSSAQLSPCGRWMAASPSASRTLGSCSCTLSWSRAMPWKGYSWNLQRAPLFVPGPCTSRHRAVRTHGGHTRLAARLVRPTAWPWVATSTFRLSSRATPVKHPWRKRSLPRWTTTPSWTSTAVPPRTVLPVQKQPSMFSVCRAKPRAHGD